MYYLVEMSTKIWLVVPREFTQLFQQQHELENRINFWYFGAKVIDCFMVQITVNLITTVLVEIRIVDKFINTTIVSIYIQMGQLTKLKIFLILKTYCMVTVLVLTHSYYFKVCPTVMNLKYCCFDQS